MDQYEDADWDTYDIDANKTNFDYGQKQYNNYDELMVEIFKYLREQSEKLYIDNNGLIDNCLNVMIHYEWSDELLNKSGFFENYQVKLQLYAQGVISQYQISQQIGECQLCLEKVQLYQIGCQHYFCIDCYQNYVINSLKNSMVPQVRCLKYLCNYKLPYQMILLLNHDSKKYFKISLCQSFLKNNIHYFCCLGQECENIHSTQVGNQIDCPSCYISICIICKQLTHQPLDCDLAKRWAIQNNIRIQYLDTLMLEQYQICYNCQYHVEKLSGCNHMKCKCGAQFCYKCGQKWEGHKLSQCSFQSQEGKIITDQFQIYYGIFQQYQQQIQQQIDKNKQIIKSIQEIINKFSNTKINIHNIKQFTQSHILQLQTMKYAIIYQYYYEIDCPKQTKTFTDTQKFYLWQIDKFRYHIDVISQLLIQIQQHKEQDQQIGIVNQICQFVENFPNLLYQEKNARKRFLSLFNHE